MSIDLDHALIIEYDLNNGIKAALRIPELDNAQTRRGDQLLKLLLRPLARGMSCHHMPVKPAGRDGTSAGGQNVFVQDELGVARFHGRGRVAEDSGGEMVGPVVQNVVHEVCAGT